MLWKYGSLEAFLACNLIPLDKNLAVSPLGIGEVIRRILGRAVMVTFARNILESAGDLRLCAGFKLNGRLQIVCPIITTYVINSHRQKARLFIPGGEEITSVEGTTQGNPTVVRIYALGSLPLLNITT